MHGGTGMNARLRVAWLPDGKRLQLRQGPLDAVIQAQGRPGEVGRVYDAAIARARALALELTAETIPRDGVLWRRAAAEAAMLPGAAAPVLALDGAVADEILAAMCAAGTLERAFVNNRGAVALHLAEGQSLNAAMLDRPEAPRMSGRGSLGWRLPVRGVVVKGWRFDAFALGCVDRLLVAAGSAARADLAVALIAGAMQLPGLPILRLPARQLDARSPLGDLPVLAPAPGLGMADVAALLERGAGRAAILRETGLIQTACLGLHGKAVLLTADLPVPEPFICEGEVVAPFQASASSRSSA